MFAEHVCKVVIFATWEENLVKSKSVYIAKVDQILALNDFSEDFNSLLRRNFDGKDVTDLLAVCPAVECHVWNNDRG